MIMLSFWNVKGPMMMRLRNATRIASSLDSSTMISFFTTSTTTDTATTSASTTAAATTKSSDDSEMKVSQSSFLPNPHPQQHPQQKRQRRRSTQLSTDRIPTMAQFMHSRTVIHQYRSFLKTMSHIPDQVYQTSLRKEVQERFRLLQHETDTLAIQMAVKEGQRQLHQIQSLVGYKPTTTTTTTRSTNKNKNHGHDDDDSWLNTKDPEDPRGRVGVEWPWQS